MRQNISSRLTHTCAMWLVQTFRQVSRSLALQQRRVQVARSLIMHCTSLCFSFPVPYLDPADRNWTWPYRQRTKYNSDLFYRSRSFTSTDVETGLDGISEAEFPGPTLFRPLGVFHEGRTGFFSLWKCNHCCKLTFLSSEDGNPPKNLTVVARCRTFPKDWAHQRIYHQGPFQY